MLSFTFILTAFFITGFQAIPPEFVHEKNPSTVYLVESHSRNLACEATGSNPINYFWLKDGNRIELEKFFGNRTSKNDLPGAGFTIKEFSPADQGIYQCVAQNNDGRAVDAPIELRLAFIELLPKFHHTLSLTAGMPYSLRCPKVASVPRAKYNWVLTNEQSTPSGRISGSREFVPLTNVTNAVFVPENGQIFFQQLQQLPEPPILVCFAENPAILQYTYGPSFSFRLNEPSDPKRDIPLAEQYYSQDTVEVRLGEDLNLFCIVSGSKLIEADWKRLDPGKSLDETRTTYEPNWYGSMTVTNVTYADAGQYECQYKQQPIFNRKFRVTVKGPPRFINGPPSSITFQKSTKIDTVFDCGAQAIPEPRITFYKDGAMIANEPYHVVSGSKLIIKSNFKKSAAYQCKVQNSIGMVWANFHRNVQ